MALRHHWISELALLLVIQASSQSAEKDGRREMLAVVSALSGSATVVVAPSQSARALHLFEWLPAGAVIAVGSSSQLTLAYADGTRYAMGEKSRATIFPERPKRHSGTVNPLEPVPAMPRFAALATESRPGARSAAIRMRGGYDQRIGRLYPCAGSSTLPDATVLKFSPIPGVVHYRVLITDDSDNLVFKAETATDRVAVPAGALSPGAHYSWEVWTMEMTGPRAMGESEFVTLSADQMQQRNAFRARMEAQGDAESLALLGEVDRRLGLLFEAREGFRAALDRSPSNSAIRRILDEIEKALSPP